MRSLQAPSAGTPVPHRDRLGGEGPFRAHHVRPGDPYELSDGHTIECMAGGERHGRANLRGGQLLATDPQVEGAGVDVGVEFNDGKNLRAPDVSVGALSDQPGFSRTLPPLAVEFADVGQDEAELARKIRELLAHGTRYVWVVRMQGPRRVEVHEPGQKVRIYGVEAELRAEGVLRNPVPVLAFYEQDKAHEVTLRNLLNRNGIASLDALRTEAREGGLSDGRAEGRADGLRLGIAGLCQVLGLPCDAPRRAQLERMNADELAALLATLTSERRWP